ncbi:MAG: Gfo/Idh/MocA family oxidoreductase, partial [Pirellulales bacterium]|nr:Gfo/Idh/MocA family oxidoreductase [Pirellulales bacterium]
MKTTRRNFLKKSGSFAVSAIALSSTGRSRCFAAPSERPRVANVGLRNQGIADANRVAPFADIVVMADIDSKVLGECREKISKKQNGNKPEGFKDYRKVLDRKDIDAVFIATPDHWHTKIAVEAMRAGKDVFCQKPLTLTIDEGKLLRNVVKETGRVFQVGTQQRSEGPFLQAVAIVQNGRLGKIKKVTCGIGSVPTSGAIPVAPEPKTLDWDFWLGPAPKVAYRALPEIRTGYGGGVPLYSNCHYSFR